MVWEIVVWETRLSVLWSTWSLTESRSQSGGSLLLSSMTFLFLKGRGIDFKLSNSILEIHFFCWGVCLFIITAKPFVCLFRIVSLFFLSWGFRRTMVDLMSPRATRNPHIATRHSTPYEVASISRLLKITGLFCRILSLLTKTQPNRMNASPLPRCSAQETYNFKEPTTCSHPIQGGYD